MCSGMWERDQHEFMAYLVPHMLYWPNVLIVSACNFVCWKWVQNPLANNSKLLRRRVYSHRRLEWVIKHQPAMPFMWSAMLFKYDEIGGKCKKRRGQAIYKWLKTFLLVVVVFCWSTNIFRWNHLTFFTCLLLFSRVWWSFVASTNHIHLYITKT